MLGYFTSRSDADFGAEPSIFAHSRRRISRRGPGWSAAAKIAIANAFFPASRAALAIATIGIQAREPSSVATSTNFAGFRDRVARARLGCAAMKAATRGFVMVLGLGLQMLGCTEVVDREGVSESAASRHVDDDLPYPWPALMGLMVSQIHAGGGEPGSQFRSDYIELFNSGTRTRLTGLALQFVSGSEDWDASKRVVALPDRVIESGQYFLVRLGSHGPDGAEVASFDLLADGPDNLLAPDAGRVAIVKSSALLDGCGSIGNPCTSGAAIDRVGYGPTSEYDGRGPTPAPADAKSILRRSDGCFETNNNRRDFDLGAPVLRTTASPRKGCPILL